MSRQHFIIPPRFRGLMDEGRSVTKAVTGEEPSVLAVIIDCHPLGCVSAAHFATVLEHAIIFMNAFWMLSSGNRCVCCIQSPARFHTPPPSHPTRPYRLYPTCYPETPQLQHWSDLHSSPYWDYWQGGA